MALNRSDSLSVCCAASTLLRVCSVLCCAVMLSPALCCTVGVLCCAVLSENLGEKTLLSSRIVPEK